MILLIKLQVLISSVAKKMQIKKMKNKKMVPDQLSKILGGMLQMFADFNFFKFIGNLTKKILGFGDPEKPNSPGSGQQGQQGQQNQQGSAPSLQVEHLMLNKLFK